MTTEWLLHSDTRALIFISNAIFMVMLMQCEKLIIWLNDHSAT
jgi:hypothetical protein